MARDRKRAKQRRARGAARPFAGREHLRRAPDGARAPVRAGPSRRRAAGVDGGLERADLPAALEHAGDVDEFDAALVARRGRCPR